MLKEVIRNLPGGAVLIRRLHNVRAEKVPSSADYWEERYRSAGNSGAGSYARLARFKADFLNDFVTQNAIASVIEFGSGDGAQLRLAQYPSYIGVDISRSAIENTREMFRDRPDITLLHASEYRPKITAELGLSLDVIYHLVETEVFESYMNQLFDAATRFVIVYASNDNRGFVAPHVRHRKFTTWVKRRRSDFTLVSRVPNAYPEDPSDPENTSFADFYVFEKTAG